MWDPTGLHRPRPGENEGLWTERGDLRGFPRDFGGLGTGETPPQGSCHVYTARYPPLAVGDSLAPTHPPSASVCFLEPGTRLAVRGVGMSRPRGPPSWNPGPLGDWSGPGGSGPAGEREGAPCEGGCLGGGGKWGSTALPP